MSHRYNILPLALGTEYYVLAKQSGLLIPPLRLNDAAISLPAFNVGLSMSFGAAVGHAYVDLPTIDITLSMPVIIVEQSVPVPEIDMDLSMDIGEVLLVKYVDLPPLAIGVSFGFDHIDQAIALADLAVGLDIGGSVSQSISIQPFEIGLAMNFGETASFETGSAIIRYFCVLTGTADGITDIVLPMSSFQARRRSGDPTYLRVVVPTVDYADEIAARPNGKLKIQQAYEQNGVIKQIETIMETDLEDVRPDEGGTNKSTTLVGYSASSYEAKEVTLNGVVYRSTRGGKYRYRLARPHIFLNPGDTVTISNDGVVFEIDTMSYFINPTTSTIELEST